MKKIEILEEFFASSKIKDILDKVSGLWREPEFFKPGATSEIDNIQLKEIWMAMTELEGHRKKMMAHGDFVIWLTQDILPDPERGSELWELYDRIPHILLTGAELDFYLKLRVQMELTKDKVNKKGKENGKISD